jgi:hypothetical protein
VRLNGGTVLTPLLLLGHPLLVLKFCKESTPSSHIADVTQTRV